MIFSEIFAHFSVIYHEIFNVFFCASRNQRGVEHRVSNETASWLKYFYLNRNNDVEFSTSYYYAWAIIKNARDCDIWTKKW